MRVTWSVWFLKVWVRLNTLSATRSVVNTKKHEFFRLHFLWMSLRPINKKNACENPETSLVLKSTRICTLHQLLRLGYLIAKGRKCYPPFYVKREYLILFAKYFVWWTLQLINWILKYWKYGVGSTLYLRLGQFQIIIKKKIELLGCTSCEFP